MVTHEELSPQLRLDELQRRSIEVAVAQHLRSRRGVAAAQKALLELGLSGDEIVRRRRAESGDPALAHLLRWAVTIVITRGRLTEMERRQIARSYSEQTWNALVEATMDAYAKVIRVETRSAPAPESTLDLEVGDY